MKRILTIAALLTATFTHAQKTVENYLLKDIGSIAIPVNMELQSGNYKKLVENYQQKFGYEVAANRIVFQQKGLNDGSKQAYGSYARVIITTTIGNYGDFEKLTTKITLTPSELTAMSNELKGDVTSSFIGTGLKLIKWYGVQIVTVNGRSAIKISYLRQLNDQPYVTVFMYKFLNNDRIHELILSYREDDAAIWKPLFSKILNSFKITNVR